MLSYRAMRITTYLALAAGLLVASASAAQTTAFVGGRVIDGTGRVIENGTVVITSGKIVAVGPASTAIPGGATRVDLGGKTILPGLVNAHGHVAATSGLQSDPKFYTRDNLLRQLRTYAKYGVTTVFSLGDDDAAGDETSPNGREAEAEDRAPFDGPAQPQFHAPATGLDDEAESGGAG